jgi:hypothetical protein
VIKNIKAEVLLPTGIAKGLTLRPSVNAPSFDGVQR